MNVQYFSPLREKYPAICAIEAKNANYIVTAKARRKDRPPMFVQPTPLLLHTIPASDMPTQRIAPSISSSTSTTNIRLFVCMKARMASKVVFACELKVAVFALEITKAGVRLGVRLQVEESKRKENGVRFIAVFQ